MSRITNHLFRLILITLLLFCSTSVIRSQPEYLEGKVLNSISHEPVAFATIRLKLNQLGIYANSDGDFKILQNKDFLTDSVIVSCIGFRHYSVAYKDLNTNAINTISLEPIVYSLAEVNISTKARKLGSIAIIRRALQNIKRNYPQGPFNYVSYYRDYQKEGQDYINLNEAIVQTLDNGFDTKSSINRYRLLDFRKNNEFQRLNITPNYELSEPGSGNNPAKMIPDAKLGDQYGNELFVLMVHDPVRNFNTRSFSFIETLSENFLNNHNFAEPVPVYDNNLLLFKIIFNGRSRVTGESLRVSGAIYIQARSYAIHKIEYSCSYIEKGKAIGDMFNVDIEYGQENSVDSLMCLKYISFNNYFKVESPVDTSYFKVLNAHWEMKQFIDPTLVVQFNNNVDQRSAAKLSNYSVKVGKKDLKISAVRSNGKIVYLKTKDKLAQKTDSCWIDIKNVKDTEGNIVFHHKTMELYQYRELFVQEYNKSIRFPDTCYMKYMPLEKNCKSSYTGNEKYWMNTPAIKIK